MICLATLTNRIVLMDGMSGPLSNIRSNINTVTSAFKSMTAQFALGNIAASAVMSIGNALASLPGEAMKTAGAYAGVQARLSLLAGSQEKVAELNDEIYKSALRSRGSFETMADSVAKIGMTAKEAFPDPSEIAPFVEGIQKLFVVGGTDKVAQGNAMLQLTQALGSGRLQGDEFRSIAEAAPLIEQMVAKTMGVSQGELKNLASQGQVTAEIIKQAIFENMDEINEQFKKMPMTFDQEMQLLQTVAYKSFGPVMDEINKIVGGEGMQSIVQTLAGIIPKIANEFLYVIRGIVNNVKWLASVFSNLSGVIEPVLMGIGIVLTGLAVKSAIAYGSMAFGAMTAAAASMKHAIASGIETAQILYMILAQEGLNAALYACPLTWIIGLVMALVLVFYGAIAVINYFAGTSISATGIIFGAFAWLFTGIVNSIKMVANIFIAFANFLGSVFQDPLGAAYNLFVDIWNAVVEYVASAVNSIIDLVNDIPGMSKVGTFDHISAPALERKNIEGAAFYIKPFEYGNAAYNAKQAYEFGASDWFGNIPSLEDLMNTDKWPKWPTNNDADANGEGPASRDTAGNTGKTAKNTGRMADSMDIMEEEIKSMRDYADQEAINRYTTARVTIDVGGISQNISGNTDVDGVINSLVERLQEGMASGAEAVHV